MGVAPQLDEAREQLAGAQAQAAEWAVWRDRERAARAELAQQAAAAARLEDQLRHAEEELDAAQGKAFHCPPPHGMLR